MERLQFLYNLSFYLTIVSGIVLALSGAGLTYFKNRIDNLEAEKKAIALDSVKREIIDSGQEHKKEIIDAVVKNSDLVIESTKKTMEENKPIINAPNAQIVTSNQSGGNNTVINNLNLPEPTIRITEWQIRNAKTSDSTFHNRYALTYQSAVTRSEVGFRIKRLDVVSGKIELGPPGGMLMSKTGHNAEKNFMFIVATPQNGTYYLDVFTKQEIIDAPNVTIDYLKAANE